MADVPHTKNFADVQANLGHLIPCYKSPSGCCADDDTNGAECVEECLMLRIYRAGYLAALADLQNKTKST